ncbi:uncharacterized protein [Cicer arietinum]|uniref:uncharacterized protein n=2 Tax=Cicer arietinum TaxID=3827 RepID=UPI003CC643AC
MSNFWNTAWFPDLGTSIRVRSVDRDGCASFSFGAETFLGGGEELGTLLVKVGGGEGVSLVEEDEGDGVRAWVGWNESGQPVDPNSSMFVSYIGAVVRQNVPITIDNWRDKALKDAKDIIWNDIQTTFVLDEERKSYVLRVAGKIHRGFRSHLSNFYLKDREGNTNAEPPKIYQHYISKDEWSAFVSKRSDPAFVNISTANRERASNPKHPYKKSRMGYARLDQQLVSN